MNLYGCFRKKVPKFANMWKRPDYRLDILSAQDCQHIPAGHNVFRSFPNTSTSCLAASFAMNE